MYAESRHIMPRGIKCKSPALSAPPLTREAPITGP